MKSIRRRNNLDVQADILRVALARGGALKTQLVYQANLNFSIVKGYLEGLIGSKLLQHDGRHYYTTPKGVTYLKIFESLGLLET